MTSKNKILNDALFLATEWGEHWLDPIQERLSQLHPSLKPQTLDEYNELCKKCMKCSHNLVTKTQNKTKVMKVPYEAWQKEMLAQYPWANKKNLNRLYSQSMYYSMK